MASSCGDIAVVEMPVEAIGWAIASLFVDEAGACEIVIAALVVGEIFREGVGGVKGRGRRTCGDAPLPGASGSRLRRRCHAA